MNTTQTYTCMYMNPIHAQPTTYVHVHLHNIQYAKAACVCYYEHAYGQTVHCQHMTILYLELNLLTKRILTSQTLKTVHGVYIICVHQSSLSEQDNGYSHDWVRCHSQGELVVVRRDVEEGHVDEEPHDKCHQHSQPGRGEPRTGRDGTCTESLYCNTGSAIKLP